MATAKTPDPAECRTHQRRTGLVLLLILAGLAVRDAWGVAPDHLESIRKLKSSEFFRDISCADFASSVLSQSGLPRIGMDQPVNGQRGDFDRLGEKELLPRFRDSVVPSRDPYQSFQVEAGYDPDEEAWTLTWARKFGKSKEKSTTVQGRFHLVRVSSNNRRVCEVRSLESGLAVEGKELKSEKMSTDACLEILKLRSQPSSLMNSWFGQVLKIKQIDCEMFLRYSAELKQLLYRGSN